MDKKQALERIEQVKKEVAEEAVYIMNKDPRWKEQYLKVFG